LRKVVTFMFVCGVMLMSVSAANAWHANGRVFCDVNGNEVIDSGDTPLKGVIVTVENLGLTFSGSDATDSSGFFKISLPDDPDSFVETLDPATLPFDAVIIISPTSEFAFSTTEDNSSSENDWLISSSLCEAGVCWLTGGGVKFESSLGLANLAQKGPQNTLGGNVNPGCSPTAGEGGQWNHVAHSDKIHFQGFAIQVVRCGNVDGIEPGSESPETPFNFIEFEGTGRVQGIKGNKAGDEPLVYFFARAEDRNEPGSNGAKDGEDIDRYFLHVFTDPSDPSGSTVFLLDLDGDPDTVDPVTITGGNLQIHISSCDNPPLSAAGSVPVPDGDRAVQKPIKTQVQRVR